MATNNAPAQVFNYAVKGRIGDEYFTLKIPAANIMLATQSAITQTVAGLGERAGEVTRLTVELEAPVASTGGIKLMKVNDNLKRAREAKANGASDGGAAEAPAPEGQVAGSIQERAGKAGKGGKAGK